jgi:hypothetical protein
MTSLQISTMISNKKKRTQEEKLNAKNSKKLIKFATTLTSTLTKHKSAIPPMLLSVMQRIDTNMKKYFPDMPEETRYRYVYQIWRSLRGANTFQI